MFKALKDGNIIAISNADTEFECIVKDNVEEDNTHTCDDYAQISDTGYFVLRSELPAPTYEEQKEKREQAFSEEADPLRYDYDEDCARYGYDSEQALASKALWLAKKDEIRARYPYPTEE